MLFHKFPEESIQAKIIAPVVPSIILPQGNIGFLDQFCLSDGASGNYPLRAPKKRRSTLNCPEVLVLYRERAFSEVDDQQVVLARFR